MKYIIDDNLIEINNRVIGMATGPGHGNTVQGDPAGKHGR